MSIYSSRSAINLTASAGDIAMASSSLSASGNLMAHSATGGIDLTAGTINAGGQTTLLADQGDIGIGSIESGGARFR